MKNKKSDSIWKVSTFILLIACISLLFFVLWEKAEDARSKFYINQAVAYINNNLIKSSTKATLSSMKVDGISIGKLYQFAVKKDGEEIISYISSNGKYLISSDGIIDITKSIEKKKMLIVDENQTEIDGGFRKLNSVEVCNENGKPLVYFFGLNSSSDSNWEYPVFKDVVSQFKDSISFHDNFLLENGLNKDQDVFSKYSEGNVPVLIIGCKYYRVGSGQGIGEEKEKQILKNLMCEITNNSADVCAEKNKEI
ncbi:MAG: hypothetical protein WC319_00305 [Candidatus Paceibacterota bacterium]|jgi:hypothetical protein